MPQLKLPRGWNEHVHSAILQAISLGRHAFFLIVGRMARQSRPHFAYCHTSTELVHADRTTSITTCPLA